MSKLIFRIKNNEKKWEEVLTDLLDEDTSKKCIIEGDATASERTARVYILDFKNDQSIINKLKGNSNIISAFIVDNKQVQTRIV